MSVLGGDEEQIKRSAGQLAGEAKVLGGVLTTATLVAAAVAPPVSVGLGIAAAIAHLWAAVQDKVANDPVREDWYSYPPAPSEALRSRRYHDPLDDWTAALAEQAHCIGAALLCAERLEGLRTAGLDLESDVANLQRSLGRFYLARAHQLRVQVEPGTSGHPLHQALMRSGYSPGVPTQSAPGDALETDRLIRLARERFGLDDAALGAFHVTAEEWADAMDHSDADLPDETPPLFLGYLMGFDPIAVDRDATFELSIAWSTFGHVEHPPVRRFTL